MQQVNASIITVPPNISTYYLLDMHVIDQVEFVVQENAQLHLVSRVLVPAQECMYRVQVNKDAQVIWHAFFANPITATIQLHVQGPGASARLFGVSMLADQQSVGLHTVQSHDAPYSTSEVRIKGVLQDQSRLNYRGLIDIGLLGAQSNAVQSNKNILLAPGARAQSRPHMQVLNNDVICSHGSASGAVSSEHLNYLLSRGLTYEQAHVLIINGFVADVLDGVDELIMSDVKKKITEIVDR